MLRRWAIDTIGIVPIKSAMTRFALCLLLFVFWSVPAWSQDTQPNASAGSTENTTDTKNEAEEQETETLVEAPYDDKFLRLAEVLGAIHRLRNLCGAEEGNKWRDQMSALLEAEKPKPERKARIIARFHRGYRAFDQNYQSCTDSALAATDRYMREGVLLTSQITTRYGR